VNNFKDVNDHLGHKTGDRLLVAIAKALRPSLRPYDYFARIGGDEFAIILVDCSLKDARARLGELRRRVLNAVAGAGLNGICSGASFGAAVLRGSRDVATSLDVADIEMYRDKKQRRKSERDPSLARSVRTAEPVQLGGRAYNMVE
jgi:diguanylate cyclase (GGDEF)-like protein